MRMYRPLGLRYKSPRLLQGPSEERLGVGSRKTTVGDSATRRLSGREGVRGEGLETTKEVAQNP